MIQKLEESSFRKVLPLFKGPHLDLVMQAVLEGTSPGRIWVDDGENPRTAFMWNKAHCYYLVGDENNHEFNKSLEKIITEEIAPKALKNDLLSFKVHYTDGWETKICSIFKGTSPVKRGRRFYTFKKSRVDWKHEIPSGVSVEFIDESLLRKALVNTDAVTEEIESMWNSVNDFFKKGFGFCSVYNNEIVCWCTAEYVSKNKCGIGIETVEEYENQGFATVTASAFVDYCITKGVTPCWDSWDDNIPSIKVAEKVGFEKILDFSVYLGSFDEFESYLIQGEYLYGQKKYRKAAEQFEKAIAMKGSQKLYYFTGCTWALAGEHNNAFKNLKKAVDAGFDDVRRLEKDERLKELRKTKEWQKLLETLNPG